MTDNPALTRYLAGEPAEEVKNALTCVADEGYGRDSRACECCEVASMCITEYRGAIEALCGELKEAT